MGVTAVVNRTVVAGLVLS